MTRKREAQNTINPATVTLSDTDLETLDSVVTHWNLASPADPPKWDAASALAELARLQLVSMRGDYSANPRKPSHTSQQAHQPTPTARLDKPPEES